MANEGIQKAPMIMGSSAWAEEGGVQLSVEMNNGLVICRIRETSNGIDFKDVGIASVTFAKWSRLLEATGFQPKPPAPGSSTGWARVVPN